MDIAAYINHDTPFGPIKCLDVDDCFGKHSRGFTEIQEFLRVFFMRENNSYASFLRTFPGKIVGRRGSGKSMFLAQLHSSYAKERIIHLNRAETFTCLVSAINKYFSRVQFKTVEEAAELWFFVLLTCVFQHHRLTLPREHEKDEDFGHPPDKAPLPEEIESFLNAINIDPNFTVETTMQRAAEVYKFSALTIQMFAAAKECIYKLINSSSANQILITIDTLENYNLPDPNVDYAIGGLLLAIDNLRERSNNRIKITCCIPAELYYPFGEFSGAPLKVFADRLGLRWNNQELIDIAATRFAKYLSLCFPASQTNRGDLIKTSAGCKELLEQALRPAESKGEVLKRDDASVFSFAEDETALTYILRHTQSLPRHVIVLLNSVWQTERERSRAPGPHINSQHSVFEGVRDALELIRRDIIATFKFSRPHTKEYCEKCIRLLPPVFEENELIYVFESHFANTHHSYKDFLSTLIEVGVIGHWHRTEGRKHYAHFEYQWSGKMKSGFKKMALHPIFSQEYGNPDALYDQQGAVYPERPR